MKRNSIDDLFPLRVLTAVREFGTVTEAAGVLSLSPSAVSQQLQRLGRTVGTPMTVRTGRRIALTPAAHELLDRATPLLDQLDQVTRTLSAPSPHLVGRVRIAAFTTAIRGGLLTAAATLREQHPGLSIDIAELEPEKAEQALAAGRVDLALVLHWRGQPRTPHPKLSRRHLLDDRADIICRSGDTEIIRSGGSPQVLAQRPWASAPAGTLCHSWLRHMLADAGQVPRIAAELSDFALHVDFVRAGLAWLSSPASAAPPSPTASSP